MGDPGTCRVWDRGWKWAAQEGLGGTGQKPVPEYRGRGRWGHRAVALPVMSSHQLQRGCASYRMPSFPGCTHRAPELPAAECGRGQMHPGVHRPVSVWGGSTAEMPGHLWWAGRCGPGAGPCPPSLLGSTGPGCTASRRDSPGRTAGNARGTQHAGAGDMLPGRPQ